MECQWKSSKTKVGNYQMIEFECYCFWRMYFFETLRVYLGVEIAGILLFMFGKGKKGHFLKKVSNKDLVKKMEDYGRVRFE